MNFSNMMWQMSGMAAMQIVPLVHTFTTWYVRQRNDNLTHVIICILVDTTFHMPKNAAMKIGTK